MRLISFPFRFDPHTKGVAPVTVGSDQEAAEAIAMLALTRPGERELCPGFGTPDPAYRRDVNVLAAVRTGLALWGPSDVKVASRGATLDDQGVYEETFEFRREDAS